MHPLLSFLSCPLCPQQSRLNNPSTLPCGHSLCSDHLPAPHCPIPSCRQSIPSISPPLIPASSTVTFFPAPPTQQQEQHPPLETQQPKLDVTINKILSLLDRHDPDSNAPSTHPPRSPSPPSERPRKRRRHSHSHSTPIDAQEPDLLQHLRQQSHNQRNVPHDAPLLTSAENFTGTLPTSNACIEKELLSELTCEICLMLLYQPITTPCQHTFCYKCLHRSLDHNPACPLCRQDLPGYSYFLENPCNKAILTLLLNAFPALYAARGEAIAAEERDARLDTPIFVGHLTFPGMPTLLHFFEPRYRLMLRRCLEAPNPHFGIIMPPRTGPAPSYEGDYGTMVKIRTVRMLQDGRSLVETIGVQRFRVLERGTLDGYTVGRIEMVDDFPDDLDDGLLNPPSGNSVTTSNASQSSTTTSASPTTSSSSSSPSSSSLLSLIPIPASTTLTLAPTPTPTPTLAPTPTPTSPTNAELMSTCNAFLAQLQQDMVPWFVQRLNNTYGNPPDDASAFSFYVAFFLPIDEHEKAKLLPLRSARLRLRLIVHWIQRLNDNWWFSNGCVIL